MDYGDHLLHTLATIGAHHHSRHPLRWLHPKFALSLHFASQGLIRMSSKQVKQCFCTPRHYDHEYPETGSEVVGYPKTSSHEVESRHSECTKQNAQEERPKVPHRRES